MGEPAEWTRSRDVEAGGTHFRGDSGFGVSRFGAPGVVVRHRTPFGDVQQVGDKTSLSGIFPQELFGSNDSRQNTGTFADTTPGADFPQTPLTADSHRDRYSFHSTYTGETRSFQEDFTAVGTVDTASSSSTAFEMLDMVRIRKTLKVLEQEEELASWFSDEPPVKGRHISNVTEIEAFVIEMSISSKGTSLLSSASAPGLLAAPRPDTNDNDKEDGMSRTRQMMTRMRRNWTMMMISTMRRRRSEHYL